MRLNISSALSKIRGRVQPKRVFTLLPKRLIDEYGIETDTVVWFENVWRVGWYIHGPFGDSLFYFYFESEQAAKNAYDGMKHYDP